MSYKSMTVCLDNSAASSRRLDFAIALAMKHDAHLTGLHLTYAPVVMYDPYAELRPQWTQWEESIKEKQEDASENFRRVALGSGVNFDSASYRSADLHKVIAHARASDLAIMGQRNPKDLASDMGGEFHEIFVLKLGRPVLILPYAAQPPKTFDSIIVAWDGGREAARAMADAMPLLKQAKQVTVLSIYERSDREKDLPDIDIAAYLARHDVSVELERTEKIDIAPADFLLARASAMDADLLVMGAYGHHRLTELLLGGVTRSVMQKMGLPVLMSH